MTSSSICFPQMRNEKWSLSQYHHPQRIGTLLKEELTKISYCSILKRHWLIAKCPVLSNDTDRERKAVSSHDTFGAKNGCILQDRIPKRWSSPETLYYIPLQKVQLLCWCCPLFLDLPPLCSLALKSPLNHELSRIEDGSCSSESCCQLWNAEKQRYSGIVSLKLRTK